MITIIRNTQGDFRPTDIDRIVSVLNEGGIVILAVDTVYGLLTRPFDRSLFDRLDRIKGERRLPYVLAFESYNRFREWYGEIDIIQRRFIRDLIPGPITLIFEVNSDIPTGFRYHGDGIGIRISSDPALRKICQTLNSPLWATSVNRSGEPAPVNFSDIQTTILDQVDLAVDSGPTLFRQASTVIDLRRQPFRIIREGPWMKRVENALNRSAEPIDILVVCTGNICRSPLAAALLQHKIGQPESSGIRVSSAGTSALSGYPATEDMVDIARDWGIDLSGHQARQISHELLKASDLIIVVSPEHRIRLLELDRDADRRIRLLGEPLGEEIIPDPYQSDLKSYQQVADLIAKAVDGWLDEIKRMLPQKDLSQTSEQVEANEIASTE